VVGRARVPRAPCAGRRPHRHAHLTSHLPASHCAGQVGWFSVSGGGRPQDRRPRCAIHADLPATRLHRQIAVPRAGGAALNPETRAHSFTLPREDVANPDRYGGSFCPCTAAVGPASTTSADSCNFLGCVAADYCRAHSATCSSRSSEPATAA
jgi:hypothetical protein